jgi:hypothetical protein
MPTPSPLDPLRAACRQWTWDQLRAALVDFDRYGDAELAVLRAESARRTADETRSGPPSREIRCLRCHVALTYAGTKKFHEGTRWGIMGDLGELFVNKENFDVYHCPHCGKVEFFVDGIGENFRPK